jgi:proline iminopeptidase
MAKAKKKSRQVASAPARKAGDFYPPIRPYDSGHLRVSPVHEIYYEQSGNPKGKPVVFLHGGPGGGTDAKMRRFFNPKRYRIVLFDQRGCGKSRPTASLEDNTTWHLVADIEALRQHLKIDKWQVFGGSWGRRWRWRMRRSIPSAAASWCCAASSCCVAGSSSGSIRIRVARPRCSPTCGSTISSRCRRRSARTACGLLPAPHQSDRKTLLAAARSWSIWEGALSYIKMNQDIVKRYGDPEFAAAFARIECHYFVNGGWLERESQLLDDVHKIRHIPRPSCRDASTWSARCARAWALHKAWPEADFRVVPDAGHSAFEPGTARELIKATDRYSR